MTIEEERAAVLRTYGIEPDPVIDTTSSSSTERNFAGT